MKSRTMCMNLKKRDTEGPSHLPAAAPIEKETNNPIEFDAEALKDDKIDHPPKEVKSDPHKFDSETTKRCLQQGSQEQSTQRK